MRLKSSFVSHRKWRRRSVDRRSRARLQQPAHRISGSCRRSGCPPIAWVTWCSSRTRCRTRWRSKWAAARHQGIRGDGARISLSPASASPTLTASVSPYATCRRVSTEELRRGDAQGQVPQCRPSRTWSGPGPSTWRDYDESGHSGADRPKVVQSAHWPTLHMVTNKIAACAYIPGSKYSRMQHT